MHTLEQLLVGSNAQPPTPHLALHKLSVFLEHKGGGLISLLYSRNVPKGVAELDGFCNVLFHCFDNESYSKV